MPWWKSSSSSSPSSDAPKRSSFSSARASPGKNTRRESAFLWSRRGESPHNPRLTRQRKLRHLSEASARGFADLESVRSTPVSRSSSNLDSEPSRSTSAPVLLPQPLPLPELLHNNGSCSSTITACGGCPLCGLPSPMGALTARGLDGDESNSGATAGGAAVGTDVTGERVPAATGNKSACHTTGRSAELGNWQSKEYNFSSHRKAINDPNSVENVTFRLSIPTKSAPPSGFSSPVLSPRRLSNVDDFPSQGFQVWSVPEVSSTGTMAGMSPQSSPKKVRGSPDLSPLYSPAIKSPIPKSKILSAPQSPLHSKLYPENSGVCHENGANINVHPLPLPPGPVVLPQAGFSHPNVTKSEGVSMTSQWQKQKLIGSGTFGNVYIATNRHTGALCAMKEVNIIPDDPKSAESLMQLEQEIKVLSRLKHPNIVQYYGSELTEDRFYIYLEYVHPGSINKYVLEHCGAMTESVVRNFTRHILMGLAYLHSTNNIHRDIKGANLLVDVNGVVKLADFGMAKHLSEAAPTLSLKGTPYWMAPEVIQATMNKEIGYDFAVDIWSLGCTIIEMFTGKHPWSGLEGPAAMFKVLHKDPPIPENLSCEGKDFLQRCFRRNPAERPTASILLDHPFIRNANHYNLHGSIQAFAGIRINETTYSSRDEPRSKSEPLMKGRQMTNGETNQSHPETSDSTGSRLPSRSVPDGFHSLFPHLNNSSPWPSGSSMNISNGLHSVVGNHHFSGSAAHVPNGTYSFAGNHHQLGSPNNHHPYILPKPNVKNF